MGATLAALAIGRTTDAAAALMLALLAALAGGRAVSRLTALDSELRATKYAVNAKPAKLAMMPATNVP